MNVLRWLCVIPAAYLGYYLALVGGMAALALAESFCPAEALVSGMCTAAYMRWTEKILFVLFPGIAAILAVLLPTLIAPSKKVAVAFVFFALGSVAATILGVSLEEWVVLGFALFCGAVTAWAVHAYQRRVSTRKSGPALSAAGGRSQ